MDNYIALDELLTSLCHCFLISTMGTVVPTPWITVRVHLDGEHLMALLMLITIITFK